MITRCIPTSEMFKNTCIFKKCFLWFMKYCTHWFNRKDTIVLNLQHFFNWSKYKRCDVITCFCTVCFTAKKKSQIFLENHLTPNLTKIIKSDYHLTEFKFGKGGWKLIQRESGNYYEEVSPWARTLIIFILEMSTSQTRERKSVDDPAICPTLP